MNQLVNKEVADASKHKGCQRNSGVAAGGLSGRLWTTLEGVQIVRVYWLDYPAVQNQTFPVSCEALARQSTLRCVCALYIPTSNISVKDITSSS